MRPVHRARSDMYGFATTLTGITFNEALERTTAALLAEPAIGLLLPCNVIVREVAPGRVVVGSLDAQVMVGRVGKPGVKAVADQAEARLRRACAVLEAGKASAM